MTGYLLRRLLYMVFVLWAVSVVAFILIQLPPGDYVSYHVEALQARGTEVDEAMIAALKKLYGLDRPYTGQYFLWMRKMFQGNFGVSFLYDEPVAELLAERLPMTILLSILSLLFVYIVSIPIGIYSAVHQYTAGDYFFTFIGFIGLAMPNFLLALALMVLFNGLFGLKIGGLFSAAYIAAPWSLAKFWDLLKHLPVPIIVIGTAGTAGLIRVLRGTLLDELQKQYVITARSKGVSERRLLFRYPFRVVLNPMVSTVGWLLPAIVSGETIVAIVIGLPTIGPLVFFALLAQDMYLAGSTIMLLSFLTVTGTLISDILLAVVDPRIRFEIRDEK